MKVSVVIPCYNVEDYVEECLASILAQDHSDLEVICVDDGSSDGTVAKIKAVQAADKSSRIRLVEQPNKGAAAARNNGLRNSTGEYVQFMDADDLLMPRKIGHQARLAKKNNYPDLIVGSSRMISPEQKVLQERYYTAQSEDVWMHLMRTDLGNTVANFWKRSAVEAAGMWDETMRSSQEYDLMFRILRNDAKVLFDTELYTVIRKRETGSITGTNLGPNWIRYVNLRLRILENLPGPRTKERMQPYYQFLFDSIRVLYKHDPVAALKFHEEQLPKDFKPNVSPTTGRPYLRMHQFLGFRLTQKFWDKVH
ncbi:MAG: glycosyltransferase family 2 protein [Flavobacteriales bacterium]|nr:glycosyltransferase family 2 protein [Flavobacteriales bacterium]